MGILSNREALRNNGVIIALAAATIGIILGLIHFDSGIFASFQIFLERIWGFQIPDIWVHAGPMMATLNVCFYLLGAVAVYLIGKEYIITDRYVYLAVAAYLFYFPLAGIAWSSFDTISLFPSLYLLGFYFYRTEHRVVSGVLFILAGGTFILFMLLASLTGAGILIKERKREKVMRNTPFATSLILASFLLFFILASHGYIVGHYGAISMGGYGFLLELISPAVSSKPLFFIMLLVPLITFGFFGPRLLPVTIPYYILGIVVAAAGNTPEPLVALLDLLMPPLFIATILWVGKKGESEKMPTETRIIRFALFSLLMINILVFISYIPFFGIVARMLGL